MVCAFLALLGANAWATDYTWTGTSDGSTWADNNNWSPNSGYPVNATDNVTINATSDAINGPLVIENFGNITITSGFTGTLTLGARLAAEGNLDCTGYGGTINQGAHNLFVYGDMTLGSGMTITSSGGNIQFRDSGASSLTSNGVTLPGILWVFKDGGASVSLQDDLDVASNLIVRSGDSLTQATFNSNNHNVTVGGSVTIGNDGTPAQQGIANFGSSTVTIGNDLALQIPNAAGGNELNITSGSISVADDVDLSTTATTDFGTSTVTLASTSNTLLTSGGHSFYNLTLNDSGGDWEVAAQDALTCTNALTITGGTLVMGGNALTLTGATFSNDDILSFIGNETLTNVTNDTNSGTILYVGDNDSTADTYSSLLFNSYYHLTFNAPDGNDERFEINATTDIDGDLTITDARIDLNSFTTSIGGSFFISSASSMLDATSTIAFDATSGTHTVTMNNEVFENVTFNDGGGGATWQLVDNFDANGDVTLNSGTLDGNGQIFEMSGDLDLSGGTWNGATATLRCAGGGMTVTSGGATFGTIDVSNGTGVGVSFLDAISCTDLTCTNAGATMKFQQSTTHTVTGTMTVTGASGNEITIDSVDGSTQFTFDISNAQSLLWVTVDNSVINNDSSDNDISVIGTDGGNTDTGDVEPTERWIFASNSAPAGTGWVWTGAGTGSAWETEGNWRLEPSDGTDGNDGYPNGTTEVAAINATSDAITTAGVIDLQTLYIQYGFSGSLTLGGRLDLNESSGTALNAEFSLSTFDMAANDVDVYGDVVLGGGMTFSGSGGELRFRNTSAADLTCNGATIPVLRVTTNAGVDLRDACATSDRVRLNSTSASTNATLRTNNYTLTIGGDLQLGDSGDGSKTGEFYGGTSNITIGDTLEINAPTVLGDTIFQVTTGTITVGEYVNLDNTGFANIDFGTTTMIIDASLDGVARWNGGSNNALYNLTVNADGGGAGVVLETDLDVDNNIVIADGDLDGSGFTITCGGSWTNSGGSFTEGNSAVVTFDANSGTHTITTNGEGFHDLLFNDSGGGATWIAQDSLRVEDVFTITAGTLEMDGQSLNASGATFSNNGTLRLDGNETLTDVTNDSDSGTVEYVGDADAAGDTFSISTGWSFYNLTIACADSGDTIDTTDASVDVNNNLNVSGGSFDAPATTTVAGDMNLTGGTWSDTATTVTFDGGGAQSLTSASETIGNVTVSNSSTVTLQDALDLTSDLSVTAGTMDANSFGVSLGGNLDFTGGTWGDSATTLTFDGTGAQSVTSAAEAMGTIVVTNSAADVSFVDALAISNLTCTTAGASLKFQQSTTHVITGTMTLTGSSGSEIVIDSVDGSTQFTFDVSSAQAVSYCNVDNSVVLNDGDTYDIIGSMCINGGNNDDGDAEPTEQWKFIATYYWLGSTSASGDGSTWESALNWRLEPSDGSNGDDGYPDDSVDNVIINATADGVSAPASALTIGNMTLGSGYTGTITAGSVFEISGDYDASAFTGTWNLNSYNVQLSGDNLTFGASNVFTDNTDFYLIGSTAQQLTSNGGTLPGFTAGNTAGTTLQDALTVSGDVNVRNESGGQGVFVTNDQTLTVAGTLQIGDSGSSSNNGTLNSGASTITTKDFRLRVGTTNNWLSTNCDMTVTSVFRIEENGSTVSIGTSIVRITATTANGQLTTDGVPLYDVVIDTAGFSRTIQQNSDLTCRHLTMSDGTLDTNGNNITVSGNVDLTGADGLQEVTGSITLNGTGAQSMTSAGNSWNNVVVTNASADVSFVDALSCANLTCTTNNASLKFQQSTTHVVTGTMTIDGTDGNEITIDSVDGSTQFTFDISSAQTLSYCSVANSVVLDDADTFDITVNYALAGSNTDDGDYEPTEKWYLFSNELPAGTDWVWTGAGTGSAWETQENWRLEPSDGSDGNDGYPDTTADSDTVTINATSDAITLASAPDISALNLLVGFTGSLTLGGGNFELKSTGTALNTYGFTGTIDVVNDGLWISNGGDVILSSGISFIRTGTGELLFRSNSNDSTLASYGATIPSIRYAGGAYVDQLDACVVTNNLGLNPINGGEVAKWRTNGHDLTIGNTLTVGWQNIKTGHFYGSTSTISIGTNLQIERASVDGNTRFEMTTGTITVANNILFDGTGFADVDFGTSTLIMTGADGLGAFQGAVTVYDLIINPGVGDRVDLNASTLDIDGDLTISQGTFRSNGNAITCAGSWTNSGGSFLDDNAAQVTFDATSGSPTITTNSQSFYDLIFNDGGNGITWVMQDELIVENVFTITGGTLEMDGQSLTATGSTFSNDDILRLDGNETITDLTNDTDSGTIEYVGDADTLADTFSVPTGWGFYNLTVACTDSNDTIDTTDASVDINGDLIVSAGSFDAPVASTVGGDINLTGGTWSDSATTVTLDGTAAQNTTSAGETFGTLLVTNSTADISFVDALNCSNFTCTTAGATLKFQQSTTHVISGTLTLTGASGNRITVTSVDGSTQFSFDISSAQSCSFVSVANSAVLNDGDTYDITVTAATDGGNTDNGDGEPTERWILMINNLPAQVMLATPVHCPDAGTAGPTDDDFATYGRTLNTTPVLIWDIPADSDGDNLHFQVFLGTATSPSQVADSSSSQTGFEYYNGSSWVTFPSGGVTQGANQVRFTPQSTLATDDDHFWTVQADDSIEVGTQATERRFVVGARSWTDGTLTSHSTKLRVIHITELREETNYARNFRNLADVSWTDSTITAHVTPIRKIHFDEIRSGQQAVEDITGTGVTIGAETITAHQTLVRGAHVEELRTAASGL